MSTNQHRISDVDHIVGMSTNMKEFSTQVDRISDVDRIVGLSTQGKKFSTQVDRISDVDRINVNKQQGHRIYEADRIAHMDCSSTHGYRISNFDRISQTEQRIAVPAQQIPQNERISPRTYTEYQVIPERRPSVGDTHHPPDNSYELYHDERANTYALLHKGQPVR